MAEKEVPKEKDIGQIIRYLSGTFNQATSRLPRPVRSAGEGPNITYHLQTEFAYLLNEVAQGPRCLLQKNIAACNEFIDEVMQEMNRSEQQQTETA
jgi:hypothetical protein